MSWRAPVKVAVRGSGTPCVRPAPSKGLALEKREQILVDDIGVGDGHAVREAGINLQRRVGDQLGRQRACVREWYDLVVVPVHDEGRDIDLLQVLGEVGFREGLDAVVGALDAALHSLEPEVLAYAFGDRGSRPVVAEEWEREVLVELRTIVD